MDHTYAIAPPANGWYKPAKLERNPAYRRFIRSQPCAICGSKRAVEAAHTGPHGIGQKASDYSAIPLCRKCHQTGRDSYHRQARRFFVLQEVDIDSLIQELRKAFEETPHHV